MSGGLALLGLAAAVGCRGGGPSPSAASASTFQSHSYGYKAWSFSNRTVPVGEGAVADLETGEITATGQGFPNMADQREDVRMADAQSQARQRAEENLRGAVYGLTIATTKPSGHWMPLRLAAQQDSSLKNRVEAILQGAREQSRLRDWYWEEKLTANLKQNERLFEQLLLFHPSLAGGGNTTPLPTSIRTGDPFPAFRLQDVFSGKTYDLAALPGKVNLFVFWTPEDLLNATALTQVESLARSLKPRGITVVGVVARGDRNTAYRLIAARKLSFINLFDPGSALARKLGLQALPVFVVVWRNPNTITYYFLGNPQQELASAGTGYRMMLAHLAGKRTF